MKTCPVKRSALWKPENGALPSTVHPHIREVAQELFDTILMVPTSLYLLSWSFLVLEM